MGDTPGTVGVDTITTVNGGVKPSSAVATSDALLGYESGNSRPPADLAVEFVDYPFSKGGDPDERFAQHLEAVRREVPRYAVAPDVDHADNLDAAIEQADQLAEYAAVVIMVPKGVHPSDIPARFRVGLPLADWDARTDALDLGSFGDVEAPKLWQWTDYADVGDVHLLGGSPTIQREVAKYGVDVRSVDGSGAFMAAEKGSVWAPSLSRHWHPAHNQDMGLYDRLAATLDNIHAAWNDDNPEYQVPADPDEFRAAYRPEVEDVEQAHQKVVANRGEAVEDMSDQERRRRQHRGRPVIDERDADLWAPHDDVPGETWRWAERLEDATQRALDALDDGMEQTGLSAFEQSDGPVATDGGK